jgi:hypothetical protein
MTANRISQFFLIILLQSLFLLSGCGDNRNENAGISKLQKPGSTPLNTSVPSTSEGESQNQGTSTDVDWGSEVSLDEMITMTRNGRIVEIEWHVMPNILRAKTSNGEIFHLKNENKGVDLRATLINAGVKIGEGGVLFKHVF